MRTTLTIDDDILMAAKNIAKAKAVSTGDVVSDLVRKGLERESEEVTENGFPVFSVGPGAKPITLDDVKKLEDDL